MVGTARSRCRQASRRMRAAPTSAAARRCPAAVTLNGGTLRGSGTVDGSLTNNGGHGRARRLAGILTVTGPTRRERAGRFQIEIDGPTAGTEYDRLAVTGAASLDGTLAIVTGAGVRSAGRLGLHDPDRRRRPSAARSRPSPGRTSAARPTSTTYEPNAVTLGRDGRSTHAAGRHADEPGRRQQHHRHDSDVRRGGGQRDRRPRADHGQGLLRSDGDRHAGPDDPDRRVPASGRSSERCAARPASTRRSPSSPTRRRTSARAPRARSRCVAVGIDRVSVGDVTVTEGNAGEVDADLPGDALRGIRRRGHRAASIRATARRQRRPTTRRGRP